MGAGNIIPIVLSFLGSGAVLGFIQYLITRRDSKNDKTEEIINKIDSLGNKIDENQAKLCRTHILRFTSELQRGIHHPSEYFRQQIEDCDIYEAYCKEHPEFKNGYTEISSQYIRDTYKKLLEEKKL